VSDYECIKEEAATNAGRSSSMVDEKPKEHDSNEEPLQGKKPELTAEVLD
jgi:hypothetical protein